jgi:hypothetical protein
MGLYFRVAADYAAIVDLRRVDDAHLRLCD